MIGGVAAEGVVIDIACQVARNIESTSITACGVIAAQRIACYVKTSIYAQRQVGTAAIRGFVIQYLAIGNCA